MNSPVAGLLVVAEGQSCMLYPSAVAWVKYLSLEIKYLGLNFLSQLRREKSEALQRCRPALRLKHIQKSHLRNRSETACHLKSQLLLPTIVSLYDSSILK